MENKKTTKIAIVISAIFFVGIIISCILLIARDENAKSGATIEHYIEKCDFVAARKQLDKMREHLGEVNSNWFSSDDEKDHYNSKYEEYVVKVSQAQISFLIGNGDFETAQDIALEDDNYDYYLDSFLGKLISLYNKHGVDKVYEGLAQIQMPSSIYYYNKTAEQVNNAIESLAVMLVDSNLDDAKRLCSLLKPTKDYSDKKDYKEVEAIKKRIGIK